MCRLAAVVAASVALCACGRAKYDGSDDAGASADAAPDRDAQDINVVPAGAVRLLYGRGPLPALQSRTLVDGEWTAAEPLPIGATPNQWVRAAQSKPLGLEVAASISDTGAGTSLAVATRKDGTAEWVEGFTVPGVMVYGTLVRGFDLAVEASSGEILVVYEANDATPRYRTYSGGAWSPELVIPVNGNDGGPPLNSNNATWVELVSRPRFDEIALLFTSDNDLLVIVWRDDSWQVTTAVSVTVDLVVAGDSIAMRHPFVGAYEEQSGNLLVCWGAEDNSAIMHFRVLAANSSAWGVEQSISSGPLDVTGLQAAPRVGSNDVFVTVGDLWGNTRFGAARWAQSAFQAIDEVFTPLKPESTNTLGDFPADIAWMGTSAVGVYAGINAGSLYYATFDGAGTWTVETPVPVAGLGTIESMTLDNLADGTVLALFTDDGAQLWAAIYNGAQWTIANGGAPLETDISSTSTVPFSAFVRQ